MPTNLLEQLSQGQVPAPPAKLRRDVRERVNTTLVALHVVEFVVQAVPLALAHFAKAFVGLVLFSLTGTYEPRVREDARND